MPKVISVGIQIPPYSLSQEDATDFIRGLFSEHFKDIDRLINVFKNGQIAKRHFVKPLDWYSQDHTFSEKNDEYQEWAVKLGKEAVKKCLSNKDFLDQPISMSEIDAIYFVSSTGISAPSIEARIINEMSFSQTVKRIPIWGLGCAGGAAGVARAAEYCQAFPNAKVLVLSVELCSLTFQKSDLSKSNLIGTSLFADGVACALICGDKAEVPLIKGKAYPEMIDSISAILPGSLDVMGWDVRDEGLFVLFSKNIPSLVETWVKPLLQTFLHKHNLSISAIGHFIAHPGGKKVLDAFENSLEMDSRLTKISRNVLRDFGNMSAPTILYVLKTFMEKPISEGEFGLGCALGPGFSAELSIFRWS